MTEAGGSRKGAAGKPRRRHRALKDELGKIGDLRRAAAASGSRAGKTRPGRRYHAPEGRRAGLRRNSGIVFAARARDMDGSSGKRGKHDR